MAGNASTVQNTADNGNGMPFSVGNDPENGVNPSQHRQYGSLGRSASSNGASLRRLFSLRRCFCNQQPHLDEDLENEIVSQAGDMGDRELISRGAASQRVSLRFSMDRVQGVVLPLSVPDDLLEIYGFWNQDPPKLNAVYPGSPLTSASEFAIPVPTDPSLQKKQEEEKQSRPLLEYIACLVYLAVFAILGVLSRYLLQKLFGPSVAGVTTNHGILYLNLPSNMIGSFLMGWLGVVFRGDISRVSDQLAIGLTTGYLGSLTAFSGWNQKMLELTVDGHWLFAAIGFVIGLFLSAYSFIFGVETAKGFRWLLIRRTGMDLSASKLSTNSYKRHLLVVFTLIVMWGGLWAVIGFMGKKEFKNGGSGAQLWLACFFGPFGVWIRWFLARLNGCGLGKVGRWNWIPFGTLIANVSAACMMALATVKKEVNTKNCDTIATAIQFGFLGCLSTVPAFIAEFNAMRQSSNPWRAYAYAIITIGLSFGLGTLIYSVPVWAKE